ncbi:hypothetical protein H8D36_04090 [archaeon]|nr:hypothetical protein [archaeon]MBL7056880.1 hypothetical protein [Candidatus Woesearchaeota archaeon]
MKRKNYHEQTVLGMGIALIVIAVLVVTIIPGRYMYGHHMSMDGHMSNHMDNDHMNMDEKMSSFMFLRDDMRHELITDGNYKCCLETSCTYCLAKHGECDCLEDIYNGKHPCGECIGEILEGHGNIFVAKYFATAIAEKVGENHLDSLKQIISEKYNITVEEQV